MAVERRVLKKSTNTWTYIEDGEGRWRWGHPLRVTPFQACCPTSSSLRASRTVTIDRSVLGIHTRLYTTPLENLNRAASGSAALSPGIFSQTAARTSSMSGGGAASKLTVTTPPLQLALTMLQVLPRKHAVCPNVKDLLFKGLQQVDICWNIASLDDLALSRSESDTTVGSCRSTF